MPKRIRPPPIADDFDDMPDGAFFALMDEMGFGIDELVAEHEARSDPNARLRCPYCGRRNLKGEQALRQHINRKHGGHA